MLITDNSNFNQHIQWCITLMFSLVHELVPTQKFSKCEKSWWCNASVTFTQMSNLNWLPQHKEDSGGVPYIQVIGISPPFVWWIYCFCLKDIHAFSRATISDSLLALSWFIVTVPPPVCTIHCTETAPRPWVAFQIMRHLIPCVIGQCTATCSRHLNELQVMLLNKLPQNKVTASQMHW